MATSNDAALAAAKKVPMKAIAKPAMSKRTAANPASTASASVLPATRGGSDAWTPGPGEVGVRVRMYRVGFGDFFLVSVLDGAKRPVHIVVDCGVFKGTKQTGDIGSIEAAVADMAATTGGALALIVMTHRHADHIAGFARCADTYRAMAVESVWMPIWESEYEPTAARFQAELTKTAMGLRSHLAAFGAASTEAQDTARKYMENATGELAAVAGGDAGGGGGSNDRALNLLKHGLKGVKPAYLKAGDVAPLPPSLAAAGLSCRVLGPPPLADADLMKLMDLQKGVGQYLADDDGSGEAGAFAPFGGHWEVDPAHDPKPGDREYYAPDSFTEWCEHRDRSSLPAPKDAIVEARARMEGVLQASQPVAALTAAKQLNSFLNNQSLVVLFTFKGKSLLFVGDAQAGNWEHWLFETDTSVKAGAAMSRNAAQILASVDFYKVGHHGSGNATPKAVVESLGAKGRRFTAMCSTQKDVYGNEDPDDAAKGTEVPRGPLMDRLGSQSAFVRSDQVPITVDGKSIGAAVSAPLPTPLAGTRIEQGAMWVDCFL